MKHAKRFASFVLALVMLVSLSTVAFAQEIPGGDDDNATITITNASKGETYSIYKLFDATVTGDEGGSIAYFGTVPTELSDYFEANGKGYVAAKDAAYEDATAKTGMSEGLQEALKTWASSQQTPTLSAEADGSELKFTGLPYGYYVVMTTQGNQAITVTSTNPSARIVDKNSSVPQALTKTVNNESFNIGDTITYTVTFKTANYSGAGEAAKKIVSYTIEDTLPAFLGNVNVTSIVVDDDGDADTTSDQHTIEAQFTNKKIVLDWYDEENSKFLYKNGATVTLVYTATLTDSAMIDGTGNTNTVTLTWIDEDGTTTPEGSKLVDSKTIYTYAIAFKKVNEEGIALSDATFQLPFYVKTTPDTTDGAYIYAGTTEGDDLTNTIITGDDGLIVIKGVKAGTYEITETIAPRGYNLLTAPFSVTASKTGNTTTNQTIYLNEKGEIVDTETDTKVEVKLDDISAAVVVVVNKQGAELPSTGGMGTTMFYVIGGLLAVSAVVVLIMKKHTSKNAQ